MIEDRIISILEIQTSTLSRINDIIEIINWRLDELENHNHPRCMCMNINLDNMKRYGG